MDLLPGWKERLAQVQPTTEPQQQAYLIPKAPAYYAQRITVVSSLQEAQALVDFAHQRPLSHIGFDTEFRYDRPGVVMKKEAVAYDPHSIRPLLLSLALAEPQTEGEGVLYPFVVDLRVPEVHSPLTALLRLPVPFVGHFTKGDLFCLFRLGVPEPRHLWDTWVHEKAVHLGRHHYRYALSPTADEAEEARVKEDAEEQEWFRYSLVATCQRAGIPYGMGGDKARLQASFLTHEAGRSFTAEQVRYAAEDALAVARLYPLQVQTATRAGILQHLLSVEMPWVVPNARMEWRGVKIDAEKRRQVREAYVHHLPPLEQQLTKYGIHNVRSHPQLKRFFTGVGLLPVFWRKGRYSFDKKQLRQRQERHPAIPLIRVARRLHDLQADKILAAELVGADGRVHPEQRQLGAHTGRQTSRWPNILGLDRELRPLVIAEEGYGIGEVDWSQIEVGVAAAVYQDSLLIYMFNSGDVYVAMAQHFYREQLSEEERLLPGKAFKRQHPQLRERMKTCTLGIIYGMTPRGIALLLHIPQWRAATHQQDFLRMFPQLTRALAEAAAAGAIRGYATTSSGLRQYRARAGTLLPWERNWLTNHPVQGSAAVVFKAAGSRLDRLYRRYEAWLLVPFHDAFVFEAPFAVFQEVADLTARVMCEAVQEYFPALQPRARTAGIRTATATPCGGGWTIR